MSFIEAVSNVFRNYANFEGRARRSEYWWFSLFNVLIYIIVGVLGVAISAASYDPGYGIIATGGLIGVYSLGTILPSLAVACRRLHDIGKSGAYIFFVLLPVAGEILLLVWEFQDGQPWTNQYGPDPKGRNMAPYSMPYSGSAVTSAPAASDSAHSQKRKCPNCGASIDADAIFCSACGTDIREKESEPTSRSCERPAQHKKCVNCGSSIDQSVRYCPICGKNADDREIAPNPKAPSKGFSAPTDLD